MRQPIQGTVSYFRSRIDNTLQPCAVCETGDGDAEKPLVLEVSPGGSAQNLPQMLERVESFAAIAARKGLACVVAWPTGRGPGSVYQNYGEVDLFEAMEHLCSVYPIDRSRISVTGGSMGGAATWYLISHYPDVFAAGAPFCGYCDYRLWEKPGGYCFHMHPWEEPSWQSRSAAFLVENLQHTPVWMTHGEWDRASGAGVDVEHSLQMAERMKERGYAHKLTITPKTGHACHTPEALEQVIVWLLEQRKARHPKHVTLATYGLRHNRSYWVRIDQLARYGQRGQADAKLGDDGRLTVNTDNVRTLSLGPAGECTKAPVTIDGQDVGNVALEGWATLMREAGAWRSASPDLMAQKRHGVSGPIGDLFFEKTVLVPGMSGDEAQSHFNLDAAHSANYRFGPLNGGVHRGGIKGENSVKLPVIADNELSDETLAEANLVLYGTPSSNNVFARLANELPIAFEGKTIRVMDKTYSAERVSIFALFAHPANAERYVAVHGGVTPDALSWGSHLHAMLLPDYIVYDRGELLDWGFWGNDWTSSEG